jgi:hypothetical protein
MVGNTMLLKFVKNSKKIIHSRISLFDSISLNTPPIAMAGGKSTLILRYIKHMMGMAVPSRS